MNVVYADGIFGNEVAEFRRERRPCCDHRFLLRFGFTPLVSMMPVAPTDAEVAVALEAASRERSRSCRDRGVRRTSTRAPLPES